MHDYACVLYVSKNKSSYYLDTLSLFLAAPEENISPLTYFPKRVSNNSCAMRNMYAYTHNYYSKIL